MSPSIARVSPRIGRLASLVPVVFAIEERSVGVLVNGQVRDRKSNSEGFYFWIRITIFVPLLPLLIY